MSATRSITRPPTAAVTDEPAVVATAVLETVPRLMRWIREANRANTEPGLTVPQLRAMRLLHRSPGVGVSAIAEHQGIGVASASALVDRLVRRGLVDRTQDPAERRRVMLTLTAEGTARLEATTRATRDRLGVMLRTLTAIQRQDIERAMSVLAAALEPRVGDDQGPRG